MTESIRWLTPNGRSTGGRGRWCAGRTDRCGSPPLVVAQTGFRTSAVPWTKARATHAGRSPGSRFITRCAAFPGLTPSGWAPKDRSLMRITLAAYSCRDSRRVGVKPRTAFPFKPAWAPARSCSRTIVPVRDKRYRVPLELPSDVCRYHRGEPDLDGQGHRHWAAYALWSKFSRPPKILYHIVFVM